MKCEACGNEAVYRFSPDLDIDGLGACEEHEKVIQLAYTILIIDGEESYLSFIEGVKHSQNKEIEQKDH